MTAADSVPSTRRTQRERRAHTRARIIEAAIGSLAGHGYQATTTRRVAERAGVSPGTLAHYFPSRLDLVAGTLDEVGQRLASDIGERLATVPAADPHRTSAILDSLWVDFRGELFAIWIKVWFAAAEDGELYTALAPLQPRLSAALAGAVRQVAPATLTPAAWNRRIGLALHAMRGLALTLTLEPRPTPADRWPAVRAELVALLDR